MFSKARQLEEAAKLAQQGKELLQEAKAVIKAQGGVLDPEQLRSITEKVEGLKIGQIRNS